MQGIISWEGGRGSKGSRLGREMDGTAGEEEAVHGRRLRQGSRGGSWGGV